jgi:hypothetical protein
MSLVVLALAYSMVPEVLKSYNEERVTINNQTLIICSIGVVIIAICMFIEKFYLTAIGNLLNGICWWSLLILKYERNKLEE